MKKIIALLLVMAMVACLFVGCDNKDDSTGSPANEPEMCIRDRRRAGTLPPRWRQRSGKRKRSCSRRRPPTRQKWKPCGSRRGKSRIVWSRRFWIS